MRATVKDSKTRVKIKKLYMNVIVKNIYGKPSPIAMILAGLKTDLRPIFRLVKQRVNLILTTFFPSVSKSGNH